MMINNYDKDYDDNDYDKDDDDHHHFIWWHRLYMYVSLKWKKKKKLILHPLIFTNSRESSFMPHKISKLDVRYDFLSLTEDKDKRIRR